MGNGVAVGVWLGVGVEVDAVNFGSEMDERSQPMLIRAMIRTIEIQRFFMLYFWFSQKNADTKIQTTVNIWIDLLIEICQCNFLYVTYNRMLEKVSIL